MGERSGEVSATALCIGILDNDRCALNYLQLMVRHELSEFGSRLHVWGTSNPAETIQRCRTSAPATDILLIDMALDNISGVQVAAELRLHCQDIGIIGITSYQSDLYRQALQQAGGQALLSKDTLSQTIKPALIAVMHGQCYPEDSEFPSIQQARRRNAAVDLGKDAGIPCLTATERSIITLGLQGYTAKKIATTLGSSISTVYSHQRNIRNKFRMHDWHDVLMRCKELHFHG